MRRVLRKHKYINKGDTRIKIKQKQRNETKRKKIVEVIIKRIARSIGVYEHLNYTIW